MKRYGNKVMQAAYENACDCLYYGYGKQFWITHDYNQALPLEISNEIWHQAFEDISKMK